MRLLRPSLLYGKHGRLGVGRTKFFEDYVHRNDGAVEQFIAGTRVRRLKMVKIGQRAVAAISDEVDQLIEGAPGRAGCAVKTARVCYREGTKSGLTAMDTKPDRSTRQQLPIDFRLIHLKSEQCCSPTVAKTISSV